MRPLVAHSAPPLRAVPLEPPRWRFDRPSPAAAYSYRVASHDAGYYREVGIYPDRVVCYDSMRRMTFPVRFQPGTAQPELPLLIGGYIDELLRIWRVSYT